MRDRNGRSSGAGFRRSREATARAPMPSGPGFDRRPCRRPGTVVRRPAGVGDYRWIGDATAFEALVDELASCDVYGLDTEFHRERTYFPHLALLQLSWEGGIALVDPLAVDISPLARVLDGQGIAVLHAAEQDLEVARTCLWDGAEHAVRHPGRGRFPRSGLAVARQARRARPRRQAPEGRPADRLDAKATFRRPARLCRRRRRPPPGAAHRHRRPARGDGKDGVGRAGIRRRAHQGPLADRAVRGMVEAARARASCEVLPAASRRASPPGASAGRRQLDLPVRFVLPDLALLSIAQHPPGRREDLRRTRSLDGRHLGGGAADELLAAISARASSSPAPTCACRPPTSSTSPTVPSPRSPPPT